MVELQKAKTRKKTFALLINLLLVSMLLTELLAPAPDSGQRAAASIAGVGGPDGPITASAIVPAVNLNFESGYAIDLDLYDIPSDPYPSPTPWPDSLDSHWYWYFGADNSQNNWKGGHRNIETTRGWQSSRSWKAEIDPYGVPKTDYNGQAGGYYRLDTPYTNGFYVETYIYFNFPMSGSAPTNPPSVNLGLRDSMGVGVSQRNFHIPPHVGEPTIGAAGVMLERFNPGDGSVVYRFVYGTIDLDGVATLVPIQGAAWERAHWYFIRMGGDIVLDTFWFEIWDAETTTKIVSLEEIPFECESVQILQVGGGGKLGNVGYFDNLYMNAGISIKSPVGTEEDPDEPMAGYYPATFGFENDAYGVDPAGWVVSELPGTMVMVCDYESWSHRKVLGLYDNHGANFASAWQVFQTPQTLAWVEFYVYAANAQMGRTGIVLFGTGNLQVQLLIMTSYLWYWDGAWHKSSAAINSGVWYHIRIYFQITGATLAFSVEVDSTPKFAASITGTPGQSITSLWLSTGQDYFALNYWSFFDAVGYSWDDDYGAGDNKNPGLLLDFEPDQDDGITGAEYQLDNGPWYATLGDRVLKMPATGWYTVRVRAPGYGKGISTFYVA